MNTWNYFFKSRLAPDQLTVFAILYMVPMIHEMGDPWWTWGGRHAPLLLEAFLLVVITLIALNISLLTFLLFVGMSMAYYLVTSFPENPNHITLLVYCHFVILIALPVLMFRNRSTAHQTETFESLKPVLRLLLITLFFIAGFHKLNTDFFNPEVSCVNFVVELLEGRLFRPIFGYPFLLLVSPILLVLLYWIIKKSMLINGKIGVFVWATIAMLVIVLATGVYLSGGDLRLAIVGAGAVLTLLWQLIEGPLLFVRRLQAPILIISLVMLGTIAVAGIPMFPAVLLPLLFVFTPNHVFFWWRDKSILKFAGCQVHSIHACLFINVVGGLVVYVSASTNPSYEQNIIALAISQMFFLGGVALLLLPLVRVIFCGERQWKWEGVKIWHSSAPKFFFVFPLILFLWGMTPYMGLRTAGNFSMFSNLKTEGPTSNHLLLGSNPIKFWDYQEDLVRISSIDEESAKAGHHYDPLNGNSLPAVEFKKIIYIWKAADKKVALTYQYDSEPVSTPDITNDKNWEIDGRDWEMFWLDFRPVQASGPNHCRW